MAEPVLPKTLYVHLEESGSDEEWYQVAPIVDALAEMGKVKIVGVYQLVETVTVESNAVATVQRMET